MRVYKLVKITTNRLRLYFLVLKPIEHVPERTIFVIESTNDLQILRAGISKVETYLQYQLSAREFHGFRVLKVHWSGNIFILNSQVKLNRNWRNAFRKPMQVWNPKKGDIVYFSSFNNFKLLRARDFQKIQVQCKIVTNIYDILPLTNPEWFKPYMVTPFMNRFEIAYKYSDSLIVNCDYTKREILRFVESNSLFEKSHCKVDVVHLWDVANVVDFRGEPLANKINNNVFFSKSSKPLVILVSTFEPRKGYVQLIEAAKFAWESGAIFNLMFIGQLGWIDEETFAKFRRFLEEFESSAIWVSTASDELLVDIFKSANLLVSPSLGEGFGLPVAEAIKLSVPVLANSIPTFKEVFGKQVVLYGQGEEYSTLTSALSDIDNVIEKAKVAMENNSFDGPDTINELMRAFGEL